MLDWLLQPWPWYVAGPVIGLTVPVLLLVGNKNFGLSSSFRHLCAAVLPTKLPFFTYDWKREGWNLVFIAGSMLGAGFSVLFLSGDTGVTIAPALAEELTSYGIAAEGGLAPSTLFSWDQLFTVRGFISMVFGGFLVGFGTRYAGGCTSGHSITGLATFQLSSLKATLAFMAGGFFAANLILPFLLS
jgi:uncharacterized membrane protein YedE/YeeE